MRFAGRERVAINATLPRRIGIDWRQLRGDHVGGGEATLSTCTTHFSEASARFKVTRYWKTGTVDYKKLPELKGIDLEPYRSASWQGVKVTVS